MSISSNSTHKNMTGYESDEKEFDVVIINGNVADVVKMTIEKRNIGISGGKIACITAKPLRGKKTIDAAGLLVSPGFIDFHSHIDGNRFSAECMVRQGGTTTIGGERNLNSTVIRTIDQEGFLINQGFSISQTYILRSVAGISEERAATKSEILTMEDIAIRFIEDGAFGICFGLELLPGTSYEEILAMARIAKRHDRLMIVHLRKDGREALQSFDEIIRVARETGVRIQILQLLYMVGIGGAMADALKILDKARAEGLDITADSGLYNAFSVCIGTGVFDAGWESEYHGTSVNNLLISSGIHIGKYCNDELFKYLREGYPQTLVSAFVCDDDAIAMALEKDYVYVSTNAADGPHYMNVGAPEASGTFPRLLGRHVRENGDLSLMDALQKITILPAKRYGLYDVGSIDVGKQADIVVFDPDTIIDKADFVDRGDPNAAPAGIAYVLIGGKVVVKGTELTSNTHCGRLLKL